MFIRGVIPVYHYATLVHEGLTFYLVASPIGLAFIGLRASFDRWQAQHPKIHLQEDVDTMALYVEQLRQYFAGERQVFALPLDAQGTPFQKEVWQALLELSYGETVSYSTLALGMGRPKAVRAVASAVASNPLLIVVPCHRVIAKDGTLANYREGQALKRALLDMEARKG
ncbi:cysteine methyltransferase [Suicoccus acidiformans]|uniref:methylated-DNA--[protein]-cysteine S-methyltransferase n=1 Tax=Suicoccus acidiformans TaxID=2036206 RepID=A0A347WN24_9LACT|nr:cysteine methyltransferase [Suicoccus acidiformans]